MLRCFVDYRLGNIPRHYIAEKANHLMCVPNEIRDCVVYICVKMKTQNGEEIKLAGTGFFVSVLVEDKYTFAYLVTAKHVIEAVQKHSVDGEVYIRLNNVNGGAEYGTARLADWKFHPTDRSVDVAVIPVTLDRKKFLFRYIPASMALTPSHPEYANIGVGDEVFVTGLFINHSGQHKNIPIIRTGNIAMMPDEPIETSYGATEVILVESRSIGGLSGSPVFVHKMPIDVRNGELLYSTHGNPMFWLGLIHGHWDINPTLDYITEDKASQTVNMGIAIAVPVGKVLEVINQPDYEKQRKEAIEQEKKKNAPQMDTSLDDSDNEQGITRIDFMNALEKIVKPASEDEK